jgi:hypothetical protein
MKTRKFLLLVALVCSLAAAVSIKAQKPAVIKGGKLCEKYTLKKAAKDKAEGSRVVKLKAFDRNDESLPPDAKKWLDEIANEETLVAHELRCGEKGPCCLMQLTSTLRV